ncbi:MAG: SH3 domain-containing protein [Actinobacteria bacterium]|nr:SH3 domain-containing protein [Actinomycetota bacterium]
MAHAAPPGGIQAWATPDPSQPPVATLAAGTPLQIAEQRGGWARVEASNGWSGWVDASRLIVQPAPAPPPPVATPPSGATAVIPVPPPGTPPAQAVGQAPPAGLAASVPAWSTSPAVQSGGSQAGLVLAIIGSALTILSIVLPWLDFLGETENAFKPGAALLFDYESTAEGGFSVGVLVLLLGAATLALSFSPALHVLRRIAGAAAAVAALLFMIQVARILDSVGDFGPAPGLFETLGVGVYAALVGGALALFAPKPAARARTG